MFCFCILRRYRRNYDTDTYNFENYGSGSGTITNVTVYIRCESDGSGSDPCYAHSVLRVGGTNYDNRGIFDLTSSWTEYSITFDANPAGGSWGRDWTAVDSLQAGVSLNSGDTYGGGNSFARCTQVWIVINYIP